MRKLYALLIGVVFFASNAFAQRSISGRVTDEKGNPVPVDTHHFKAQDCPAIAGFWLQTIDLGKVIN